MAWPISAPSIRSCAEPLLPVGSPASSFFAASRSLAALFFEACTETRGGRLRAVPGSVVIQREGIWLRAFFSASLFRSMSSM